jgi:RIO kinase 1
MNLRKFDLDALRDGDVEVDDEGRVVRPRAGRHPPKPKRPQDDVLASIVERSAPAPGDVGLRFSPSLDATSEEREWIREHLGVFYSGKLITDVLRRVKGGKEATVYCCAAHPDTGLDLIAAKLYRPRVFRSLRNDTRYRQNRPLLDGLGQPIMLKRRQLLALKKKTRFGKGLLETSWLEYEFQTLQRLYDAGVDVPRPIKHGPHVILMEYVGDEAAPAPALIDVALAPTEAQALFDRLLRDTELMLRHHCVHGDLSAYNVLYWEGQVKIIDFPQVVDPRHNPDARAIFNRDVERLCQYFARYGVQADAPRMAARLWTRYQQAQRSVDGGRDAFAV